ncbi:hypothetical protein RvY_07548-1 [Ramazzottius varieornatus]|uniref:guanylate cyclase n=1 Tax=Ramazzottius varieornatus TaxID=947166 RepID=A0A1D1V2K7_RAMVA|nr:hypothetical protein RvY_07548-1 [Ramazzottius varieornatus]
MVQAARDGMVNGEWVFYTADLFLNDVLGVAGNWKQRDGYDKEALSAYRFLFVLSIRDVRNNSQYKTFQAQVRNRGAVKFNKSKESIVINYYSATFHDAVLLFAKGLRTAYENPIRPRSYDGQLPLSVNTVVRWTWNSTFQGASGLVYINPKGDRADDLTIYRMTDEILGTFSVVAVYYGNEGAYRELRSINWRTSDGLPPLNEPVCGYENTRCVQITSAVSIGGSLAGLLILCLLGAGIRYCIKHRNVKSKHHSEWLAEWEDITMDALSTQSRMSLNSNSSLSKPSLRSDDDSASRRSKKKPPPSSGRLAFGTWQGRLVMVTLCEPHIVNLKKMLSEVKVVRGMSHDNILHFLGAVVGPDHYAVIGEYCSKGTLQDLLADETAKLDWIFRYSLLSDLVKGIIYIHGSPLAVHGRLTSACCYVDGKFVLKVGDYGLPTMYKRTIPAELTYQNYVSLYWTAPELLDRPNGPGTPEGDVYAYGIILQEIILREEPYSMYELEPEGKCTAFPSFSLETDKCFRTNGMSNFQKSSPGFETRKYSSDRISHPRMVPPGCCP